MAVVAACSLALAAGACAAELEAASPPPSVASATLPLSSISCEERVDTGYTSGTPFPITVVTVDGKPAELETANAYYVMAQAAAAAGVEIRIVSGFRTMAEQEYLYYCYTSCSCNGCNLAARPGYSNHQSGHALDLNTSAGGVYDWLAANAGAFGFSRTVPSEPWHWEWWGGGPGGGPCGRHCTPHCEGSVIVDAGCGAGDCAPFAATCVDDDLGVRCSSVFCPSRGAATVCVDTDLIGTCADGGISTGSCNAYAAWCSTAGTTSARCVSMFCVSDPAEVPTAHDTCLPDGRLAHCDDAGLPQDAAACPSGVACQRDSVGRAGCFDGGAPPEGSLRASCLTLRGWARDPDESDAAIEVQAWFDGEAGAAGAHSVSQTADLTSPACASDECGHGFATRVPLSLHDGAEHAVHVYGMGRLGGGNGELDGSPAPLRCDPLIPAGTLRHVRNPESYAAWRFDEYFDLLPADEHSIAEHEEDKAWPLVPDLVRIESGADTGLWMLDGGVRRRVTDPTAWRLDVSTARLATEDELRALPEGFLLPDRPVLVRRARDGAVFVVEPALDPRMLPPTITPPEIGGIDRTLVSCSAPRVQGHGRARTAWMAMSLLAALVLRSRSRIRPRRK